MNLKEEIIKCIKTEHGRPIPSGVLLHKIFPNKRLSYQEKNEFFDTLNQLEKQKILFKTKSNCYVIDKFSKFSYDVDKNIIYKGIISINTSGNGFVGEENETEAKYYIYHENINNAQNGDLVELSPLIKEKKGDLIECVVNKILQHNKNFYVCLVIKNENSEIIYKPDDQRVKLNFIVDAKQFNLIGGEKVLLEIDNYEGETAQAHVKSVLGNKDDIGVDIVSLVFDAGVPNEFSKNILDYANNLKFNASEYKGKRKDLTDKNIITIDPKTSKDFDDAYYLYKKNNKYFLSVSIADVSSFVKLNDILDKEAQLRTSSIYLIDRVIPMLPHILSNDLCSINPNIERLALTCDMVLNEKGFFEDIKVYPSLIKSHRRFNYDEVNQYYAKNNDLENDTSETREMLNLSLELHKILREKKEKEGYVNLSTAEPLIILDENNKIVEIKKRQSGTAQEMIEDFMVCANEAVTLYAKENKYPFLYRVHDVPDETKIQNFLSNAKALKFDVKDFVLPLTSKMISKWLIINKDNENFEMGCMMLLRCMSKAKYSTQNIGHFGLSLKNYTHFTSPIRRYADLLVHRIFYMFEFEKDLYTDVQREEIKNKMEDICTHCNEVEIVIQRLERDVNNMKFAEFMNNKIGEVFEGKISALTSFGIFVQLDNTIQGLIPIKTLGDYFTLENDNTLKGENTGITYHLGQEINVQLVSVDKEIRKIEFKVI